MATALQNNTFTKDSALSFLESAATPLGVGSATTAVHDTLDLGGDGFWEGYLVIDISAIEVATGDEVYTIHFRLSDTSVFTAIHASGGASGRRSSYAPGSSGRNSRLLPSMREDTGSPSGPITSGSEASSGSGMRSGWPTTPSKRAADEPASPPR